MTKGYVLELKNKLDKLTSERERSAKSLKKLRQENAQAIRRAEEAKRLLERA